MQTAKPIGDYDIDSYDGVVVIDGTWTQANSIVKKSPVLANIRHVTLGGAHKTTFWRYQSKQTEGHLATIEAIYYLFRERDEAVFRAKGKEYSYDGRYDNLLWLYVFTYRLIQRTYKNSHRHFTTRHVSSYIQY